MPTATSAAPLHRLPIEKRPSDYFFIGALAFFLVIAFFIDIINVINPTGGYVRKPNGEISLVVGITPEVTEAAVWPPQLVYRAFYWWYMRSVAFNGLFHLCT